MKDESSASIFLLVATSLLPGCQGPPPASREEIALSDRLNQQQSALNSRVHVAFDPAKEALVTDAATELVADYAIDIAWRKPKQSADGEQLRVSQAVQQSVCDTDRNEIVPRPNSVAKLGEKQTCVLQSFYQPSLPLLRVVNIDRPYRRGGLAVTENRLTFLKGDEIVGETVIYSPNSGSQHRLAPAIAATLGLKERTESQLADATEVRLLINRSEQYRNNTADAKLSSLISEGHGVGDIDPGRVPIAVIQAHSAQLTVAFAQERGNPSDRFGNRMRLLADLIGRLPDTEWQRQGNAVLEALAVPTQNDESDLLVSRLGDLGPVATPVLTNLLDRRLEGNTGVSFPIAYSACVIGKPGAQHFGPAFVESWRASNSYVRKSRGTSVFGQGTSPGFYRRCLALPEPTGDTLSMLEAACWRRSNLNNTSRMVYLALLRFGMGDEAEAISRHSRRDSYRAAATGIGPSSPPAVCRGDMPR